MKEFMIIQLKNYLAKDFMHRCAYCNTLDNIIEPLYFTVDHYVPRDVFKGRNDTLDNDYNNYYRNNNYNFK